MYTALIILLVFFVFFFVLAYRNSPKELQGEIFTDTDLYMFRWQKAQYMGSKEWKTKKHYVLNRDQYQCQSCGIRGVPLHVHHLSGYNLIPNEPTSMLISLCENCHNRQHQVHGFPQTYSDYMNWKVELV